MTTTTTTSPLTSSLDHINDDELTCINYDDIGNNKLSSSFNTNISNNNGSNTATNILSLSDVQRLCQTTGSNEITLNSKNNQLRIRLYDPSSSSSSPSYDLYQQEEIQQSTTTIQEQQQIQSNNNNDNIFKIELTIISDEKKSSSSSYSIDDSDEEDFKKNALTPLNPLRFIVIHEYNNPDWVKTKNLIPGYFSTPRDEAKQLSVSDIIESPSLQIYKEWINDNILKHLKSIGIKPIRVPVKRILATFGLTGMGKLTVISSICSQNKINLIYVPDCYFVPEVIFKCFLKAKKLQPCVVFFDKVDYAFHNPAVEAEFNSSLGRVLNRTSDNVWTILSLRTPPMKVINNHEGQLAKLIMKIGTFCDVPVSTDKSVLRSYIIKMLSLIAESSDYPFSLRSSSSGGISNTEWNIVIERIIAASSFCTFSEIYDFLADVFARFYNEHPEACSSISQKKYPDPAYFFKSFDRLPFLVDDAHQHSLSRRNVAMENFEHNREWSKYLEYSGQHNLLTVPSFSSPFPPLSSILHTPLHLSSSSSSSSTPRPHSSSNNRNQQHYTPTTSPSQHIPSSSSSYNQHNNMQERERQRREEREKRLQQEKQSIDVFDDGFYSPKDIPPGYNPEEDRQHQQQSTQDINRIDGLSLAKDILSRRTTTTTPSSSSFHHQQQQQRPPSSSSTSHSNSSYRNNNNNRQYHPPSSSSSHHHNNHHSHSSSSRHSQQHPSSSSSSRQSTRPSSSRPPPPPSTRSKLSAPPSSSTTSSRISSTPNVNILLTPLSTNNHDESSSSSTSISTSPPPSSIISVPTNTVLDVPTPTSTPSTSNSSSTTTTTRTTPTKKRTTPHNNESTEKSTTNTNNTESSSNISKPKSTEKEKEKETTTPVVQQKKRRLLIL